MNKNEQQNAVNARVAELEAQPEMEFDVFFEMRTHALEEMLKELEELGEAIEYGLEHDEELYADNMAHIVHWYVESQALVKYEERYPTELLEAAKARKTSD
jgi:hypothetical protein